MNKKAKIGSAACILALALMVGGCGAHAGFSIGKKSTPTSSYASIDAAEMRQGSSQ